MCRPKRTRTVLRIAHISSSQYCQLVHESHAASDCSSNAPCHCPSSKQHLTHDSILSVPTGIVRLIEDVEKNGGEKDLNKGMRFSELLSSAAEGAVTGRLDDFRYLVLFVLILGVGGLDAFVLFLDGLAK